MAKSEEEAEKYRKSGNEYYAQRKLDAALNAYGQSILHAPESSESLSYGFGNRSAVLYEMEAYSECLRDIERAFACQQCPDSLKEKLHRRKAKCEADMNCKKISKVSLENKEAKRIPKLCGGPNKSIPGVASKIAMEHNAQSGRRLVAVEEIQAGSVIIVERPYTSILLEHTRAGYCHNCNETLPLDFVPCNNCVDVRFCSEACLDKERVPHALECGQVARLFQVGLGYLAYKIFCVTSVEDMAEFFFCQHLSAQRTSADGTFGLKPGEIYDGGYRCVWNLMAHHADVKSADLELYRTGAMSLSRLVFSRKQWLGMAVQLVNAAKNVCDECKSCPDSGKVKLASNYITSVFLRLIEILISNAHAISAMVRDKGASNAAANMPVERTGECKIASAIYPTASLMNHSCRPNIFSSFIGKTQVVRAARKIAPGEEVLNCYGPQFGRMMTAERKEALKQQYFFDCACSACMEPEFINRENMFTAVACPKCPKLDMAFPPACFNSEEVVHSVANAMIKDPDGPEFVCTKCKHRIPAMAILEKIDRAIEKLEQFLRQEPSDAVRGGDKKAALETVEEAEKLLEKLSDLVYVHNKELSEWRDNVAEWLLKEENRVVGGVGRAISLMEVNLFTVGYIYGEESIELANEIIKFLDVISTPELQNPDFPVFLTPSGRPRLRQLSDQAKKIFEIHYGPDSVQITELKAIVDSIPLGGS